MNGDHMRMRWLVTILFIGTVLPRVLLAQWPRELEVDRGTIIIYQPQIESFEGNNMQARAAVSVQTSEMVAPVFGTVWLAARVETDMDERLIDVVDIAVRRIRFPNSNEAQEDTLATVIEAEFPVADLSISLDRVLVELTELEDRRASVTNLNNMPPVIEFRDSPTILVTIDGDPILERIENSDHRQVVNTPFTIIRSSGDERYFLYYAAPRNRSRRWRPRPRIHLTSRMTNRKKVRRQPSWSRRCRPNSSSSTGHPSGPRLTRPTCCT